MNEKQIQYAVSQGWPEPKFQIGDTVKHWARDHKSSVVEMVEVDDKWLSDYGVKCWSYSNMSDGEQSWWGRDDDLELV